MLRSEAGLRSFSRPAVATGMTMMTVNKDRGEGTLVAPGASGLRRPAGKAIIKGASALGHTQMRANQYHPFRRLFSPGRGKFIYPDGNTPISSDYMKNKTFYNKSRDQWDYNKINEEVTKQSEFGNMEGRDFFFGTRDYDIKHGHHRFQDTNSYKWAPRDAKQLWEHFDQYTQPGSDPKIEAARAVQEHWDAENFYYPGESWKRNRPAWRSTPKEILNKETWYSFAHVLQNFHKIHTQGRPRSFNPRWPPPGFRMPKYPARKDLCLGNDHPELVHEWERWYWYKMWWGNNARLGIAELVYIGIYLWWAYWAGRAIQMMHCLQNQVWSNAWYPGKRMVRLWGEARDAEEGFWWQSPLDNDDYFPEQGLNFVFAEWRFGMINYENKMAELKAIHGSVENIPPEPNQHLGSVGHFPFWLRSCDAPIYSHSW